MQKYNWKMYGVEYEEEYENRSKNYQLGDNSNIEKRTDLFTKPDSFSVSDYLIDVFYVIERMQIKDINPIYEQRLSDICSLLDNIVIQTKEYIDSASKLVMPNEYTYTIEKDISDYLDNLYLCVINNNIGYYIQQKEASYNRILKNENYNKSMVDYIKDIERHFTQYVESNSYLDRKNMWKTIRQLPDFLGGIYLQRKTFYFENRKKFTWNVHLQGILQASMLINSKYFENYAMNVINFMQRGLESEFSKVCNQHIDFVRADNLLIELQNFVYIISNTDGLKKKYVRRNGCFGLLKINYNDNLEQEYIAFSGLDDCEDIKICNYFKLNEDTRRNLLSVISKLASTQFPETNLARTTENIMYYKISDTSIKTETILQYMNRVPVIDPSALNAERRKFSCCERKMLSELNNRNPTYTKLNSYTLFTRFKACCICKLALYEFEKQYKIPETQCQRIFQK